MLLRESVALRADEVRAPSGWVDADVHVHTPNGLADVYPHMPLAWRRRFELKQGVSNTNPLTLRFIHPARMGLRADAISPDGAIPGSDPEFTRQDYLERFGIGHAILNSLEAAAFAVALAGPDEANVLCSAYNDYFLEHWAGADDRYRYAICVSPQDPMAAVAEIERLAGNPAVPAVYLPCTNILLGNRHYWPIYRAAQDAGLPILLHLSGAETVYQGGPIPAGGLPENFSERRAGYFQFAAVHLNSLVFSGALQKFPQLNFAFVEYGWSWLVPHLWKLDAVWRETRVEVPHLVEPPSRMLAGRVRFGTQPLDEPANRKHLDQLLAMLGTEWLLFCTDYPHWDGDEPANVIKVLDDTDAAAVMRANGERMFRL